MATKAVRRKEHWSRHLFVIVNYTLCGIAGLICLLPLVHILAVSLSSKLAVYSGHVTFLPVQFTWDNYIFVTRDSQFFHAYGVTVLRAVLGWAISMTLLVLAAYPLSQPQSRFGPKTIFTWVFVFTMLFNGGMIPTYLLIQSLGLLDSFWVLIFPLLMTAYNMFAVRNHFQSIPASLAESAYIDGAGPFTTLFRIILPISLPTIAAVAMFYMMRYWNSYKECIFYTNTPDLQTLQVYLRNLLSSNSAMDGIAGNVTTEQKALLTDETVKMTTIAASVLPVLIFYPFIQRFYTKGMVAGAVKG